MGHLICTLQLQLVVLMLLCLQCQKESTHNAQCPASLINGNNNVGDPWPTSLHEHFRQYVAGIRQYIGKLVMRCQDMWSGRIFAGKDTRKRYSERSIPGLKLLNKKKDPSEYVFSCKLVIIMCVFAFSIIGLILSSSGRKAAFQLPDSLINNREYTKFPDLALEQLLHPKLDELKSWKSNFFREMGQAWSNNTFNVYILKSSMERVASFSGFRNPSPISMLKLSKFGFFYTKEGETLQCADCSAIVQASKIVSPPSDRKYHASPNCQFAQTGEGAIGTACVLGSTPSPSHAHNMDKQQDGEQDAGLKASGASNSADDSEHNDDDNNVEGQKGRQDSGYASWGNGFDVDSNHQATGRQNTPASNGPNHWPCGATNCNLETRENYEWHDKGHFRFQAHECLDEDVVDDTSPTCTSSFADPDKQPYCNEGSCSLKVQSQGLEIDQLPLEIRDPQVVSVLEIAVKLTVRIRVPYSKQSYPTYGDGGSSNSTVDSKQSCVLYGSGSAILDVKDDSRRWLKKLEDMFQLRSDQLKIWKSDSPKYYFSIVTSKHVVFDQSEAVRATVDLWLNSNWEDSVRVNPIAMIDSPVEYDYSSYLICYTTEKKVFEKLLRARQWFTDCASRLPPNMKEVLTKNSLVVSCLPDKSKMIYFGKSAIARYEVGKNKMEYFSSKESLFKKGTSSDIREVLLYNVSTGDGSSGSPVFTFRKSNTSEAFKTCLWVHNGIEKRTKLRGSNMKKIDPDCPPDEEPIELDALKARLTSKEAQGSHPMEPQCNPTPNEAGSGARSKIIKKGEPPLYQEFFHWKDRLATFVNFRSKCPHTPEELSLGGFFYTGRGDCVRCFYCGLGLKAWRQTDDMYAEHKRSRENCGFLKLCLAWSGGELQLDLMKKGPVVPAPKDGVMTPEFTISLLTQENRILQQQRLCKMCFRYEIRELFLPCGEIHTCEECAAILSTCPSCDTKIDATVSVFMS